MAHKKKRRTWMGIEERKFFETFGPKEPARSLWEALFGKPVPVQAGPGTPKPPAQAPVSPIRPLPPIVDPRHFWDVPQIWSYVQQAMSDPGKFRVPPEARRPFTYMVKLVEISPPYNDVQNTIITTARYFGIPDEPFRGADLEDAWRRLMIPVLVELERKMNIERPPSLPGSLRFDFTTDGGYFLSYYQ